MTTFRSSATAKWTCLVITAYLIFLVGHIHAQPGNGVTRANSKCVTFYRAFTCAEDGEALCQTFYDGSNGQVTCDGGEVCFYCNSTTMQFKSTCVGYENATCTAQAAGTNNCGDVNAFKGTCKQPVPNMGLYNCHCENPAQQPTNCGAGNTITDCSTQ